LRRFAIEPRSQYRKLLSIPVCYAKDRIVNSVGRNVSRPTHLYYYVKGLAFSGSRKEPHTISAKMA